MCPALAPPLGAGHAVVAYKGAVLELRPPPASAYICAFVLHHMQNFHFTSAYARFGNASRRASAAARPAMALLDMWHCLCCLSYWNHLPSCGRHSYPPSILFPRMCQSACSWRNFVTKMCQSLVRCRPLLRVLAATQSSPRGVRAATDAVEVRLLSLRDADRRLPRPQQRHWFLAHCMLAPIGPLAAQPCHTTASVLGARPFTSAVISCCMAARRLTAAWSPVPRRAPSGQRSCGACSSRR